MAEHHEPSTGPQRAEGANGNRAADPVECYVYSVSGEFAHPSQEVLVHRERGDSVSFPQPRASGAEFFDDADEFVAGRERRLRHAEIGAGAQHCVGVRHAGGQNPDAGLPRARPGNVVLDHPQDLGPAVAIDDDALHRLLLGC